MIPMSEDRRNGQKLSPNEYLGVFMTARGQVTIVIRRDHGAHWVLSREMFEAGAIHTLDISGLRQQSDADVERVTEALRLQIDTTRHLLGSGFALHDRHSAAPPAGKI